MLGAGAIAASAVSADEQPLYRLDLPGQSSGDAAVRFARPAVIRFAQADITPRVAAAPAIGGTQQTAQRAAAAPAGIIQEVTVTATKRSERLEDVPMSIGIITAADINRRALVNSEDYLRGVPGVNQTGDFLGQSLVIRGLETSPAWQNSQSGTTVATYFGETPTTNSAGAAGNTGIDIKLVDIERVEVLRGPQGTAFGNSSLGGVVRTIPVAPKL